jgi:hypothetical protein
MFEFHGQIGGDSSDSSWTGGNMQNRVACVNQSTQDPLVRSTHWIVDGLIG